MSKVTGNETDAEKISRLQGEVHGLTKALTESEANCNRIIASVQKGEPITGYSDNTQLVIQVANLEGEITDLKRQVHLRTLALREVEQVLGQAMAYPWYRDDEKNFPDATDADGVCIGEHTTETLAMEAAQLIVKLQKDYKELQVNSIPQSVVDSMRLQIQEARDAQISMFDLDYPPRASQGEPSHEVQELLTADDVNRWIQRIDELTQANRELNAQVETLTLGLNTAETTTYTKTDTYNKLLNSHTHQEVYRAQRISVLENCIRWTLRKITSSQQHAITSKDIARTNQMWVHLFPPSEPRSYREGRDDSMADGMGYATQATRTGRIRGMNYNAPDRPSDEFLAPPTSPGRRR